MADIFQGSLLTIAAASSPSSTAGCFTGYHETGNGEEFVLEGTSGDFMPVVARPAHRHWIMPSTSASQPYWPLLSRGWVFQEILLSPRVLHVGRTELIWESATRTQCECGALITGLKQEICLDDISMMDQMRQHGLSQSARKHLSFIRYLATSRSLSMSRRLSTCNDAAFEFYQLVLGASRVWHSAVEHYSALNLTKASDCLPALSGLAHRIRPVLGKSDGGPSGPIYLAGLWKMTLVGDLLWRVDMLKPSSNTLPAYRAPSWSWASACTNVQYWADTDVEVQYWADIDQDEGSDRLHIIRCDVPVAGENPFGEVFSGSIVVRGELLEAELVFVSHRVGQGGEISEDHDPFHYEVLIVDSVAQLPFYPDYILSSDGPGYVNDGEVVFLLKVVPEVALVLRPTARKNEYRRLGILRAPRAYSELYDIDLFADSSEVTTVTIV